MRNVLVIGAGPAGCIAALVLARGGVHVTIVEQHRFPRDKVCGECLSALAVSTLEKLGLATGLRELGSTLITDAAVHSIWGGEYRLTLPHALWGISRKALDQFLLDEAVGVGVEVLQPVRCEALQTDELGIGVRDLQSNEVRLLRADQIIVADGKGGLFRATPVATGDFGIKAHFTNVNGSRGTIELFGGRGVYGGLAAIEGGMWNTAFSVPARRLREHRGNVQSLFDEICSENPGLGHRFSGARRCGQWLAAPLPRFAPRGNWPTGVIPVGNAAAALEPIGGEGMGLAIVSAEMAARRLLRAWGCEAPAERDVKGIRTLGGILALPDAQASVLKREYDRLWRVRRGACRFAAMVVSRPWASRVLLPLLNLVPLTRRISMWLMGKNHLKPSISDIA